MRHVAVLTAFAISSLSLEARHHKIAPDLEDTSGDVEVIVKYKDRWKKSVVPREQLSDLSADPNCGVRRARS